MYESDQAAVANALSGSGSPAFTETLIDTILTLPDGGGMIQLDSLTVPGDGVVTVSAGTDVVFITGSDTMQTSVVPPSDVPVIIFQGLGGVNVEFDDGTSSVGGNDVADRVVVGSAGGDNIVISDNKDTQIVLGTGDSTVVGGAGEDTVMAGLGNSTIVGGTGNTTVVLAGTAQDYTVVVVNGDVVITGGNGITTTTTGINYVQVDGGDALVFAESTVEAGVASLYQTAFGRTAEGNGLEYWFDIAAAGASLSDIANGFANSAEFDNVEAMSNSDFVSQLYLNTFGRTGEAEGLQYWLNALANGASRADLINQFASVAALNLEGALDTEATVIGSVTIIHDIV